MPAVPSLHPLTRTIAAGSPQKTVFYNNTRPQSKTDNVNGFMVRYTVQLMFLLQASIASLPLPRSLLLLPVSPGVSRPLSASFSPLSPLPLSFILLGSPSLPLSV